MLDNGSPSFEVQPFSCSLSGQFASDSCDVFREKRSSLVSQSLDILNDKRDALMIVGILAAGLEDCRLALKSARYLAVASVLDLPVSVSIAATMAPLQEATSVLAEPSFTQLLDDRFLLSLDGQPGHSVHEILMSDSRSSVIQEVIHGVESNSNDARAAVDVVLSATGGKYTAGDIAAVLEALDFTHALFADTKRDLSPHHPIHLLTHAAEVGVILLHAGAARDVVVAGILHDVLEAYVDLPQATIAAEVSQRFGLNVLQLVLDVTERPKGSCTWWERKISVIEPLIHHTSDVAAVVAASKISTLGAGVNFYEQGDDSWSKGSLEENVALFDIYRRAFEAKGIPVILQLAFCEEVMRLRDVARARSQSIASS